MRLLVAVFVSMFLVISDSCVSADEVIVEAGKQVKFDYTLSVNGQVVDSSEGQEPMQYVHGQGAIIPGLENALDGMAVGEETQVVLQPEEAYGPVNPNAIQEIPRSALPQDKTPEVGMVLKGQSKDGKVFPGIVTEVRDDVVVVDLNHPLAGKVLTFNLKVVEIK